METSVNFVTENYEENVIWQAFSPWLRRNEDEMKIKSINEKYEYINMQFHWWKKTRLKCIQKNINFTENLSIFIKQKGDRNALAQLLLFE